MLIIECSQAKILFVSDTVSDVLNEEPENWIGSCLYDSLHPKVMHLKYIREDLLFIMYASHRNACIDNNYQHNAIDISLVYYVYHCTIAVPSLRLSSKQVPSLVLNTMLTSNNTSYSGWQHSQRLAHCQIHSSSLTCPFQ